MRQEGGERERERGGRWRLADRLTERRKQSEIFPQLSVRVLMWFKVFFFFLLRNFEDGAFDV